MWVFVLLGAVCLLTLAGGAYSLAPWLPSFERDLSRIFALVDLKDGERFYDLGSGDGRVVRAAAEKKKVAAVGVEIALPLYAWSLMMKVIKPRENVVYICKSLFNVALTDADVVYVFGRPGRLGKKLTEKLQRELKPGARVLSYTFPLENMVPTVVDKPSPQALSLYLYRF
jgi:SAM-dependent methyltransferase